MTAQPINKSMQTTHAPNCKSYACAKLFRKLPLGLVLITLPLTGWLGTGALARTADSSAMTDEIQMKDGNGHHSGDDIRASLSTLLKIAGPTTSPAAYEAALGIRLDKEGERVEASGTTLRAYNYSDGRTYSLGLSDQSRAGNSQFVSLYFSFTNNFDEKCLRLIDVKQIALDGDWRDVQLYHADFSHGFTATKRGLELRVASEGGLRLEGMLSDEQSKIVMQDLDSLEGCAANLSILSWSTR